MPIQISKPVTVYRLWDNDDLRAVFAALAQAGWLCSLAASNDPVEWVVHLQHNTRRVQVSASVDDVLVWDGTTVVTETVDEFNAAADPADRITKGQKP